MAKINMTEKQVQARIDFALEQIDMFQKQLEEQIKKGMSERSQEISKMAKQRWLGQHDIWSDILVLTNWDE